MEPTEHEMTVACDALARWAYLMQTAGPRFRGEHVPEFDELDVLDKLHIREAVLPHAVVALTAIADRRLVMAMELEDVAAALRKWNGPDGSLVINTLERRLRELVGRIRRGSVTTTPGCHDCGLAYGGPGWCDAVVPDDVWATISPTGDEGGLLCLTCIARRLQVVGITDVPLQVTSGPWSFPDAGAGR